MLSIRLSLAAAPAPVSLHYTYHVGDVLRYKTSLDMLQSAPSMPTMTPVHTHIDEVRRLTVLGTDEGGGTITIHEVVENVTFTLDGITVQLADPVTAVLRKGNTLVVTSAGEIITVNGEAAGPTNPAMGLWTSALEMGIILPDKPVKVGDQWTHQEDGASPPTAGSFSRYALTDIKVKDGLRIAMIRHRSKGQVDMSTAQNLATPVASTGDYRELTEARFDATNGALLSVRRTVTTESEIMRPRDITGHNGKSASLEIEMRMDERRLDGPVPPLPPEPSEPDTKKNGSAPSTEPPTPTRDNGDTAGA